MKVKIEGQMGGARWGLSSLPSTYGFAAGNRALGVCGFTGKPYHEPDGVRHLIQDMGGIGGH